MPTYQFNNQVYKTVAKNIKKYRNQKNISIATLAKYAKITEEYLINLENLNNDIKISIYDLYKISIILEISIEKFFQE